MNRQSIFAALLALLVITAFAPARADSWLLPEKRKYFSPGKKYYLEVTPKKLESQLSYFDDKVQGKENAGAVKGMKDNRAKGAFYARRPGGGYSKKYEFPLLNEVSPVSALVSDSGDYVVTFDNWHSVGYGDDVVVIYRPDGRLVKKYGLADLLTEGDIEMLPRSVSSIHWGGEHYVDERNGLLVLKVVTDPQNPRGEGAKFHDLKIELATGRPLEPKRDLLPQFRVFSSVAGRAASTTPDPSPGEPACASAGETFDAPGVVRIPPEQFYAKAKERPLPPYPPLAKAAHVESTVVVEILVSKAGEVICARTLSGHRLLHAAARTAALKWKFEPVEAQGEPVKAIGIVALDFKLSGGDVNSRQSAP